MEFKFGNMQNICLWKLFFCVYLSVYIRQLYRMAFIKIIDFEELESDTVQ